MSVYGIKLVLVKEGDPQIVLATKYARIHAKDVPAGEYHLKIKTEEILKDVRHFIGFNK